MTTRRAFLESLGLALGVGVAAKAAVSRPERVVVGADHIFVAHPPGMRGPFSIVSHDAMNTRMPVGLSTLRNLTDDGTQIMCISRVRYPLRNAGLDKWGDVFEIGRQNRDRQLR